MLRDFLESLLLRHLSPRPSPAFVPSKAGPLPQGLSPLESGSNFNTDVFLPKSEAAGPIADLGLGHSPSEAFFPLNPSVWGGL